MEPGTVLASTVTGPSACEKDSVFADQFTLGLYFRKKSKPRITSAVSDGKTLATTSIVTVSESPFYTPNDKCKLSSVFTTLPSARVTISGYPVTSGNSKVSATALVTKLCVAPESTIHLITLPLHTASN